MVDGEELAGCLGGSSGNGANDGSSGAECIELCQMERRMSRARGSDIRELATNICRQYIRSSSRYHLLDHLKDIGKIVCRQVAMVTIDTVQSHFPFYSAARANQST